MDPDQAGQAAEGPGQQQEPAAALAAGAPAGAAGAAQAAAAQPPVLAAAQQPDAEEVEEPEGDSSEEGWEENEEGERGPDSLLQLVQRQVLRGIETAASGMQPPFAVGGSLGRGVSVALAVTQPPAAGAAEGSAATASQPAVAVRFPEGGQAALQALEAVCQPASFGVGTEAVLDEGYRRALAVRGDRLFPQFDLAQHGGLLDAVRRLLLPDAALLTAKLHGLNVYKPGGFFRPHRDTPRGDPRFVGSLVVCLPVGHAGGALRVEHGGRSVTYDWGPGAAAGEVQWAAFFSDCLHEVLPVTDGARVTLAWELFAYPANAAQLPAQAASLPNGADSLLHALRKALDSNSFLVNGGRLGFPLQHAYPNSLAAGITPQDVPAMLKGADAAIVHVLQALGLRIELLRVWQDECNDEIWDWEPPPVADADSSRRALLVSTIQPGHLRVPSEEEGAYQDSEMSWLADKMKTRYDCSIVWLGGREAFPDWVVGAANRFYYGNYPTSVHEFYCSLGLVAHIPPYAERLDRTAAELAWAGAGGTAGGSEEGSGAAAPGGSPGPASPASKKPKTG